MIKVTGRPFLSLLTISAVDENVGLTARPRPTFVPTALILTLLCLGTTIGRCERVPRDLMVEVVGSLGEQPNPAVTGALDVLNQNGVLASILDTGHQYGEKTDRVDRNEVDANGPKAPSSEQSTNVSKPTPNEIVDIVNEVGRPAAIKTFGPLDGKNLMTSGVTRARLFSQRYWKLTILEVSREGVPTGIRYYVNPIGAVVVDVMTKKVHDIRRYTWHF